MSQAEQALAAMQEVEASNDRLTLSDWETAGNTTGEKSVIAEYQPDRPLYVREGTEFNVAVIAYEEFTNSTGSSDQTQYSFAHDAVDSDTTPNSLVLYQGNTRVTADSVDFGADTFTYTDDGSGDPIHAYYAVGDQAELEVRKVAPSNTQDRLKSEDVSLQMRRDVGKDPITFDWQGDPLTGVVPAKWRLQVALDAPYSVQFADDTHTDAEATNFLLSLPVRQSRQKVTGLGAAIRQHAANGTR